MRTRGSIAGHPIHAILVVFPVGLFLTALVFDVLGMLTAASIWKTLAFYVIGAGIVGGLAAAVFGFVDYLDLTGTVARTATWHMALNLTVVSLFTASWLLRTTAGERWIGAESAVPQFLTILGGLVLLVSGWLGGHLVYVHGIGVDTHPRERG
jgi:uncharacterized membrane protein